MGEHHLSNLFLPLSALELNPRERFNQFHTLLDDNSYVQKVRADTRKTVTHAKNLNDVIIGKTMFDWYTGNYP